MFKNESSLLDETANLDDPDVQEELLKSARNLSELVALRNLKRNK